MFQSNRLLKTAINHEAAGKPAAFLFEDQTLI